DFGPYDRPIPSVPPKRGIVNHHAPEEDVLGILSRILFLEDHRAVRYRALPVVLGHPFEQLGRVKDLDEGGMKVLAGAVLRVVLKAPLRVSPRHGELANAILEISRGSGTEVCRGTGEGWFASAAAAIAAAGPHAT